MIGLRTKLEQQTAPPLSPAAIDQILQLVEKDNFLQILYSYKIETIATMHDYFLEIENYRLCQRLKETIENQNKVAGKNYKL
jgi:hypothetical protein